MNATKISDHFLGPTGFLDWTSVIIVPVSPFSMALETCGRKRVALSTFLDQLTTRNENRHRPMLWLRQESGHIERHDAVCAMLMIHRTDKLSDLLIFLLLLLLLLAVESPDHSLPSPLLLPRLLVGLVLYCSDFWSRLDWRKQPPSSDVVLCWQVSRLGS